MNQVKVCYILLVLLVSLNASLSVSALAPDQALQEATEEPDTSKIVIQEGIGFNDIRFDNPDCFTAVSSLLGDPELANNAWLSYRDRYGLEFLFARPGPLQEIRLIKGFRGRLSSGISISSSKSDVIEAYGAPSAEDNGGKPLSRMRYQQENIVFYFRGDKVSQIVLFPGPTQAVSLQQKITLHPEKRAAAYSPFFREYRDTSEVVVNPGVGFNGIILNDKNCTKKFVKQKLGRPRSEITNFFFYDTGMDFIFSRWGGPLREIWLGPEFSGRLDSNIFTSSSMEDVFAAYGASISEEHVKNLPQAGQNRVLYRDGFMSKITYEEDEVVFSFSNDIVNEIILFSGTPYKLNSRMDRLYNMIYPFFSEDASFAGYFVILGLLLLIPFNWSLARGSNGALPFLLACLAGMVIWIGPAVVSGLEDLKYGHPVQLNSFLPFLLVGVMFGIGIRYQHSFEHFIFRRFSNNFLLFLPKAIAGVFFLSAVSLLSLVALIIVTYPFFFQGDNGEALFMVPYWLAMTAIVAFFNTVIYSLLISLLKRDVSDKGARAE